MRYLVTGGAGFMGSNYVRYLLKTYEDVEVLVYDKLSYAGRIENIKDLLERDKRIKFVKGDICNEEFFEYIVKEYEPDVIVNFAAETHVDRSINEPAAFIKTNILGVYSILEVLRRSSFSPRLVHISTDEVYGSISEGSVGEESPFNPSSPYSASKASGDLLVRAYYKTYGLDAIVVRPSNNYGPYQYPEKLIPKTIIRALHDKPIPIYGSGEQVRDWLFVEDFAEALEVVVRRGAKGEAYNIPGFNEKRNIDVVKDILRLLGKPETLIKHVADRPGHDYRYSMRGDKILSLGWKPKTSWEQGLRKTIEWYITNKWWWKPLISDKYFELDTPWSKGR